MMSSPIPTGLLAYGMSGKLFQAPFLAAHPGFDLRAVVERTEQRMYRDYPGIRSYASAAALLAEPDLELVVVNTPSDTHYELAKQALQAGKHVLIEKPVATSTAQLQDLLALGRQAGRRVLAYQNRRWDSDFQAVKNVIESGQLGKLIEAHFRFDRYKVALNPKKFKETVQPGSGLLFDLGPHILDQALSVFGKPLNCHKVQGMHRPDSLVDDFFSLQLHYPQGLNVWLTSSLLVADPGPAYVLHGTLGSYKKERTDPQETQLQQGIKPDAPEYGRELPSQQGRLTLASPDGSVTTSADPAAAGDYRQLFEAVYQTIRHGAPYPITDEQLLWQLELLEQQGTI
jgi:predicted dehydrogenase